MTPLTTPPAGLATHPLPRGPIGGAERVKRGLGEPILGMGVVPCATAGECVSLDDELSDGLQSREGT